MKLKKILAAVAAAAVAVSTMAVSAFAADVWSGSNDLGTDWDGSKALIIDGAQFADTKGGDTVEISYIAGDGDTYSNVKICENANNWAVLESPEGIDPQWQTIVVDKGSNSYSFVISDDDVAKIQATGMVIAGYNITITKVATSGGAAPAAEASSNVAVLNKDAGYIDGQTPSVTITNADFGVTDIKKVSIDIDIAADEGDFAWNDWCGSVVKVTDADGVKYYAFGGAQVTWNIDVDGDKTDDVIGGVNGDQWLGTVAARTITLDVPVNGDFTIDIITMWYDSYAGTTYTVKTATADGAGAAAPVAEEKAEVAPEAEEAEDVDEEEEESAPVAVAETEEAAPVAEVAPAVENTSAPATGNTAVATVVAVMAVAGAAAIASKKRK